MNVDFFCSSGICVSETCADELDGDAFSIHGSAEIVPKRMRSENRNPGVSGKFFTEAV